MLVPCSGPRQVVPVYVMRNVTLSICVPWPVNENGQLSDPRASVPVTVIGIVVPPRRPLTVPLNTSPTPHSAENRPEASVGVCVVTDQVKFEQLEKSGTVTDVVDDEVAGGGDVPCTTHVPSIDGVEEFPEEEDVLVVGPSTVEVRSTPHPAASITTASELDKKRTLFFMDLISGYRTTRSAPIPVCLHKSSTSHNFGGSCERAQELASERGETAGKLHEACHGWRRKYSVFLIVDVNECGAPTTVRVAPTTVRWNSRPRAR